MELVRGPGIEMLVLSQAGIPPAINQQELTPLQREVMLMSLKLQQEAIEQRTRTR